MAKRAVGTLGRVGATALGTAIGGPAGAAVAGTLANAGLSHFGMGRPAAPPPDVHVPAGWELVKKKRAKRPGTAPSWLRERNAVVKRISVERGVSIPEASKIVKQEQLWSK